jgi:hypothetical protein
MFNHKPTLPHPLRDGVSTRNVMPDMSSTLNNRPSTSAAPEPATYSTIPYVSAQEAQGPQGCRTWQQIQKLRTDVLSLRREIRKLRDRLMEKQISKDETDSLLCQKIRSQTLLEPGSVFLDGKTIPELMQKYQNATDEWSALDDEYESYERLLSLREYRLEDAEKEFYNQQQENIFQQQDIFQEPVTPLNDPGRMAYHDLLLGDLLLGTCTFKTAHANNKPTASSTACDNCGGGIASGYYYCGACTVDGYGICYRCTDKGIFCPSYDHTLVKRTFDIRRGVFVDEELYTPARGLRVFVNGQLTSGIGDTGSEETIISEKRCREMGEQVIPDPMWINLGNQGRMFSSGRVNMHIAFPDTPSQTVVVLARVVKDFSFDLLLGNPFLEATQTMEKHIYRFVRCLFSARNLWSFCRAGETRRRFKAVMGNEIPFAALADTGSSRNVMSADWASQQKFEIRSKPENLGWITFPIGPKEATIGQVHTHISLPGGRLVPIVFDVLPTCRLPVVLGIDFILDNNIYQNYAGSFFDLQADGDDNESCCMGMGRIPWFVKIGNSIKNAVNKMRTTCESTSNISELTSSF